MEGKRKVLIGAIVAVAVVFAMSQLFPQRGLDGDEYLTVDEMSYIVGGFEKAAISNGKIDVDKAKRFIDELPDAKKYYYWNGKNPGYYNTIPQLILMGYNDRLTEVQRSELERWISEK